MTIDEYRELRKADPERAIALITAQLRGMPADYLYYIEAAQAAFELAQNDGAIAFLRASTHIQPNNSHANYCLAQGLIRIGQTSRAIDLVIDFLNKAGFHENCFSVLVEYGEVSDLDKLASDMLACFEPRTEMISHEVGVYGGMFFARHRRWDAALYWINRAIKYPQHRSRLLFGVLLRLGHVRLSPVQLDDFQDNHLMQYWNDTHPPDDVEKLMFAFKEAADGRHIQTNEADFEKMVRRFYGLSGQRILDLCEHPAAQADIIRLIWLYEHGGLYVDADTILHDPNILNVQFGRAFLTVANEVFFPVITNWFTAFRAGDPFILDCLETIGRTLSVESLQELTIFDVTGPGMMTHTLVNHLMTDGFEGCFFASTSLRPFFGYAATLAYKNDPSRNWAKDFGNQKTYVPGKPAARPIGV